MADRCAIFIDGGYLDKLCENEFGRARIRFDKLVTLLTGSSQLLRTYYYHCPPYQGKPPTREQLDRTEKRQRFYSALKHMGQFDVRLGHLVYRGCDASGKHIYFQKGVDVLLAIDILQLTIHGKIDRAVLLAGDSDYIPVIKVVKQHGVLLMLWHGPQHSVYEELKGECDMCHEITRDLIVKCMA